MKKILLIASFLITNIIAGSVFAMDATEKRYTDMLTQGGMGSLKQASQEMFNTSETNTQVLDIVAEILLQNYAKANPGDIDALSWAAKALGKSGNARYHDTLSAVANSDANAKLRKYANQALDQVGKGKDAQYTQGSVSLSKLRAKGQKNDNQSTTRSGGSKKLSAIKIGMSQNQVYDLAGHPTSSGSHITGKAFRPFNFKGADTTRLYARYKGQGIVVFSNTSHYDSTWKVLEVQLNENESGYQ